MGGDLHRDSLRPSCAQELGLAGGLGGNLKVPILPGGTSRTGL